MCKVKVQSIVCAFLLVISSLTGGQLAFAAQQSPPTEVSFSVDLPANFAKPGACDFPIRLEVSGKGGTIVLPGDRFIFTSPQLYAVVTNLESSKSVTLNITGAFHQSIKPNGDVVTVVTGLNLLSDPEAGFVLAIGNFSFIFDSVGNLIQPLTGTGQLINVCKLIASH